MKPSSAQGNAHAEDWGRNPKKNLCISLLSMFCPNYPVQEVWEGLLSKVFDAWSLKMIQRSSGEGCIDENAPSAASHDSFQRVHIAYWSHWSQLTMSMADKKFNQMIKPIVRILLLSCPCPACDLITWIILKPDEICVEFWFVSQDA